MSLTTLATVQSQLKGTDANKATGTNQQLLNAIRAVTGRAAGFGYRFEPFYYTRKITPSTQNINSYIQSLSLGDTLCECTGITIAGTAFSYGSTILPYPDDGLTPYRQLRIATPWTGPLPSWYPCCITPDQWFESVQITGFWAMRTEYAARGFWDSGLTTPALSATQTSFTTQNFSGNDPYYRTPILSPGNLLRVDSELMEIINTNANNTDLNVIRGTNGTTAVTHNLGTAIKVFEVEESISNVATRQAALIYARRGAYGEASAGGVTVTYPSDLLPELRAAIQEFNYVPYRGG